VSSVGTVGTIVVALAGALIGSTSAVKSLGGEQKLRAQRALGPIALVVGGGLLGFMICVFAYRDEVRYEIPYQVSHGGRTWIEPPRDPNGYVRIWLFGYQIREDSGPREEMMTSVQRWKWSIVTAFMVAGAGLSLLVGLPLQRFTKRPG
jgi:hypothetical protein